MALQAGVVLGRAAKTLYDETGVVFAQAELLDYLTAGQSAVTHLKPDAYSVFAAVSLQAGAQQDLPAGATQLLDVLSNVADGSTIRMIDRETLDHSYPDWQSASGAASLVQRFFYDRRDPKRFWVKPANDGTGAVNALYAAAPPRLGAATDLLVLDDSYESALHAYVVAMALGRRGPHADVAQAQALMGRFSELVLGRTAPQLALVPTEQE